MTDQAKLVEEIKALLADVAGHGARHLAEIENDLAQTDTLIGEAIEKLGASFMAIHQAVCAQQEILERLAAQHGAPELQVRLAEARHALDSHVNAAVTGLQFQDMTSQLLARALQHASGLRAVIDGVGAGGARIDAASGADGAAASIAAITARVDQEIARVDGKLGKTVRQTHMESGDVELF